MCRRNLSLERESLLFAVFRANLWESLLLLGDWITFSMYFLYSDIVVLFAESFVLSMKFRVIFLFLLYCDIDRFIIFRTLFIGNRTFY